MNRTRLLLDRIILFDSRGGLVIHGFPPSPLRAERARRFWPRAASLAAQRFLLLRLGVTGFRSHQQALGRPLGPSWLGVSLRPLPEVREPTKEDVVAINKGRPKAEAPKVHIGFRLAADVVASLKASGPGYNVRVEEALRAAGFGAKAKERPTGG